MGKLRRSALRVDSSGPEEVVAVASTTWVAPTGRTLTPGMELSVTGERGRFRFIKHVACGGKEWVDVFGGKNGHEKTRSFRPEQVAVVHRLKKLR